MKRKISVALAILQAFVAIGAIPAGFSMVIQPDGSGLGMTTDILKNSPFPDFFIPGLFLFTVNGLFNLVAAIMSFISTRFSAIPGLLLGITLSVWICVQVYYIHLSSFMQPIFFGIGLTEIVLSIIIIKMSKPSIKILNPDKAEVSLGDQPFSL